MDAAAKVETEDLIATMVVAVARAAGRAAKGFAAEDLAAVLWAAK